MLIFFYILLTKPTLVEAWTGFSIYRENIRVTRFLCLSLSHLTTHTSLHTKTMRAIIERETNINVKSRTKNQATTLHLLNYPLPPPQPHRTSVGHHHTTTTSPAQCGPVLTRWITTQISLSVKITRLFSTLISLFSISLRSSPCLFVDLHQPVSLILCRSTPPLSSYRHTHLYTKTVHFKKRINTTKKDPFYFCYFLFLKLVDFLCTFPIF